MLWTPGSTAEPTGNSGAGSWLLLMEGESRTMWQEAKKSGLSLCPSRRRHIPLPGGEEQDKAGLCSPKGRHAAEAPERAAWAAGAEVMKRDRMLRRALFRKPQRGPRRGGGRSLECSSLTAGPQLSQLLKQGRHKSRNSKGWWGVHGVSWVPNLGLQSYAFRVSVDGGQIAASEQRRGPDTRESFSLSPISNFQLVTGYFGGTKVSGFRYEMTTAWEGCSP